MLLVNWFTFHHLYSQDSHPSQVSGGLAGENPSNIVFEIGDLIGGKVISTIGGKYWNSQDEYPSTLFKPLKGSISNVYNPPGSTDWYIIYEPFPFVVGLDQFNYNVVFANGSEGNFTASVFFDNPSRKPYLLKDSKQFSPGQVLSTSIEATFPENQRIAYSFTLFDPEPEFSNFPDYDASTSRASINLNQGDDDFFTLEPLGNPVLASTSAVGLNGVVRNYRIVYTKGATPPDYELLKEEDRNWEIYLDLEDDELNSGAERYTLKLSLEDEYEAPQPLKFLIPQIDDKIQTYTGKRISIPERNQNDEDKPFIKIEFKVRSEGQDYVSSDGNKTFKFKYDVIFDQRGVKAFETGDGETINLNMYDTLNIPPDSSHNPYAPEKVFLYTFDTSGSEFNFDSLSASPDAGSDLDIIELERDNYPKLANGLPIYLSSSKSYGLVIYFADDYFTFDGQPLTFQFTAEDGSASELIFDLEVQIENDLSDKLSVVPIETYEENGYRIYNNDDSYYSIDFQENHPNNIGLNLLNIDSVDADRHPHPEMRLDFNNSTGNYEYGAGIYYEIQGSERDLFEIDERGILFFKEMPDFESLKESNNTEFEISVKVNDAPYSLPLGNTDLTKNDPVIDLNFEIIDGPDLPTLKNSKQLFRAFTDENVEIDLFAFFDKEPGFLDADDRDAQSQVLWEGDSVSEMGGKITLRYEENIFTYNPDPKFFGADSFRISYYDSFDAPILGDLSKQYLNFEIDVRNKNDAPTFGIILDANDGTSFFKNGVPKLIDDSSQSSESLVLYFEENSPISLKLPFSDSADKQKIKEVIQEGHLDKFSVSAPYQDQTFLYLPNSEYFWFVDLNWTAPELPDYESIEGSEIPTPSN